MEFEEAYAAFLSHHIQRRTGERRGRLVHRNFHGEKMFLHKVWWPLKGSLEDIHPEFEILDWRGRSYFADFAWVTPWRFTVLFEIKGFAKHVRDMDRNGFDNETNREVFLQSLGYRLLSFSYDNVANKPEVCLTLLRLFISQFQAPALPSPTMDPREKEIVRLAFRLARDFRPIDVYRHLQINYRTARTLIDRLAAKGWIHPVPRGREERGVLYRLTDGACHFLQ
ncbi:hypothetical protein [Cohnella boryungensis]|uniref:DUF559 domain-containing protein n=1 Tax=Cohnella boryungensis TaxID=768479 RepID=A0ABV8SCU4_9BACL